MGFCISLSYQYAVVGCVAKQVMLWAQLNGYKFKSHMGLSWDCSFVEMDFVWHCMN